MPDYNIAVGVDDFYRQYVDGSGYSYNYTGTLLYANESNNLFPPLQRQSYIAIDTSSIPDTDTITSATLHWYAAGYVATKRTTKLFSIGMKNASTGYYSLIYAGTYTNAGWKEHALTTTELGWIKVGAGDKTQFSITVPDPGGRLSRQYTVRAYEYPTSPDYAMYLAVTHSAPSTGAPQVITICT